MSAQAPDDAHASQSNKKIRFITNQGAPPPKRRRINAACSTCRKRKIACSGERPACNTCQQNKIECAGYTDTSSSSADAVKARRQSNDGNGEPSRNLKSKVSYDETKDHEPFAPANTANLDLHQKTGASLYSGSRNRMPYFRWLGPTAIIPGLKQMVVKVNRQDNGAPSSADESATPAALMDGIQHKSSSVFSNTPATLDSAARTPLSLPFYDTSSVPPSELITHLCTTFFTHLACNFPFLQKDRFIKDLEEKHVDAILVDAVCALAARFSTHPLLTQQPGDSSDLPPSEYGHAFAMRAKAALVDTFTVPSVAAVQAALLLAYNEFGESRDSGLWMYLGIAIRLAQDLGLQKLEGLRYEGRHGPTPKMVKNSHQGKPPTRRKSFKESSDASAPDDDSRDAQEQRAVERERVDTFWAVFFLDRVVSVGTGRRSTIRDNDIELSFPSPDDASAKADWPSPFPALIRIMHLYGNVADLLNIIEEPSDVTMETTNKLADMEARVTSFYQGLSPRLHFEAMNFHTYVKAGEGTNFVLLHFWFHTLIVLLHQPTLLKTFDGKTLQLFPNSQQLSLSSAKTIADILSYSQLIDAKATLGNPFTTQPIYIAACAFLRETAELTASSARTSRVPSRTESRVGSPADEADNSRASLSNVPTSAPKASLWTMSSGTKAASLPNERSRAKHTLLATAATQHYQLCYKALESVETYWAGTKYILTVLDQKFKGVGDPLLYTVEEGESALEQPRAEPAFTSPGWRRKLSWGPYLANQQALEGLKSNKFPGHIPGSPVTDHSQAFGWTLTGTLNSPNTNLAWHYPSASGVTDSDTLQSNIFQPPSTFDSPTAGYAALNRSLGPTNAQQSSLRTASSGLLPRPISLQHRASLPTIPTYPSGMDTLLTMPSPFPSGSEGSNFYNASQQAQPMHSADFGIAVGGADYSGLPGTPGGANYFAGTQFGNMMIESQDVDMSLLGLDMLPWFDVPIGNETMGLFDGVGVDGVGVDGLDGGLDGGELDLLPDDAGGSL